MIARKTSISLLALFALLAACGGGGGGGDHGGGGGYKVTFDGNGGSGTAPSSQSHSAGDTVTIPGKGGLAYSGYSFVGWQTKADGSGTTYAPGGTFTMGSADLTLYALWASGYAYTASHNEGNEGVISQYSIGPNGALTPMFTPTVDSGAPDTWWIAADPTSSYVYASSAEPYLGALTQFTIGPSGGALSPMSPLAVPFPKSWQCNPTRGVAHPNGSWFYVINTQVGVGGAVSQFTIGANGTLTSASLSAVGTGNTGPYAIAIDATGKYAFVGSTCCGAANAAVFQYTIDQTTGALQSNGSVPTVPLGSLAWAQPWDIKILQIASGEYAYVTNYDDGTIWEFKVDTTDGTLTSTGALRAAPSSVCTCQTEGNSEAAEDIALHPSGKYAYVTFSCCSSLQSVAQFDINQTDGTLSPMATATVLSSGSAAGIAVDPSGKFAYATSGDTGFAADQIAQYSIDQSTGALSLLPNPTVLTGAVGPSGIVTVPIAK